MVKDPYALHKKFAKRKEKVESKHKQPSPSTVRSNRAIQKEHKRAGVELNVRTQDIESDCRGCTDTCTFDKDLELCPKLSRVNRCRKCGHRVRYRYIEGDEWTLCPICSGENQ